MWLVVLAVAAVVSTALWYVKDVENGYKLSHLSLILWGTTIMVFVDHVMGYILEGGEFLDMSAGSAMLSAIMVLSALMIWEVLLIIEDPKGRLFRSKLDVN